MNNSIIINRGYVAPLWKRLYIFQSLSTVYWHIAIFIFIYAMYRLWIHFYDLNGADSFVLVGAYGGSLGAAIAAFRYKIEIPAKLVPLIRSWIERNGYIKDEKESVTFDVYFYKYKFLVYKENHFSIEIKNGVAIIYGPKFQMTRIIRYLKKLDREGSRLLAV